MSGKEMKGIILAAGRGSRLKNMTEALPKPMVEVAGKPLVAWQIAALKEAGIGDITVLAGYKNEKLLPYGDRQLINEKWDKSNMVRTLLCADEILSAGECVVSYGDILYRSSIVEALKSSRADIAITYDTDWHKLWELRFADPLDDAESFIEKNGFLIEIGRKVNSLDLIQGQYMGLLKFTPDGWARVKSYLGNLSETEIDKMDMTGLLGRLLNEKQDIAVVAVSGHWVEVDNVEDIELYESMLQSGDAWSHDWR